MKTDLLGGKIGFLGGEKETLGGGGGWEEKSSNITHFFEYVGCILPL
jgi:hypothetical protein